MPVLYQSALTHDIFVYAQAVMKKTSKEEAECVRQWMIDNPNSWFCYNAQQVAPEAIITTTKQGSKKTGLYADKSAEKEPFLLVISEPKQMEWARKYLNNGPLIMDSTFGTNAHMVSVGY